MRLALSPEVHGVLIDDDAVFLDVNANAYFCLPAIGPHLILAGDRLETAETALAEGLTRAGLARAEDPAQAGAAVLAERPPPPARSARALVAGRTGKGAARHGRALTIATWTAARPRAFHALLPPVRALAGPPSAALLDDIAVFRRAAPWLPIDGACLFRSHMLLAYLAALGHRASWVFGVRTWPFRAHCWLQAGDVALDDEAERLIAYHPIMVR